MVHTGVSFSIFVVILTICYSHGAPGEYRRVWSDHKPRIIGGTRINITEVPYMAMLWLPSEKAVGCGASIIHKRFVLTAKHCTEDLDYYFTEIRVGTDDTEGPHDTYNIDKVFIQEEETKEVAVIKLTKDINFNERVQQIKMADPGLIVPSGAMLDSIGFGATSNDHPEKGSRYLLKVDIPYFDDDKCAKAFEHDYIPFDKDSICAGGVEGKGNCYRDSGGALRYKDILVGVVWKTIEDASCAQKGIPTRYGRVSSQRDFIDQVIKDNS